MLLPPGVAVIWLHTHNGFNQKLDSLSSDVKRRVVTQIAHHRILLSRHCSWYDVTLTHCKELCMCMHLLICSNGQALYIVLPRCAPVQTMLVDAY
jgi:hypothetical protein